jgi:putative phosphoesterase
MKIAIISDSHDNVPNIDEALKIMQAKGVELIIHCGDVCAPSVLKYLGENFTGPIHLSYGNVDGDKPKMQELATPNITLHGEVGGLAIDNLKIAFTHFPDNGRKLAESGKYNLVFYGHNHKPWEEVIGQTKLANPGTLAGLFARPTFALYDTETKKLELKILYT